MLHGAGIQTRVPGELPENLKVADIEAQGKVGREDAGMKFGKAALVSRRTRRPGGQLRELDRKGRSAKVIPKGAPAVRRCCIMR